MGTVQNNHGERKKATKLFDVNDIPDEIHELFIKRSTLDAHNAISEKVNLEALSFMFYKAYIKGLTLGQFNMGDLREQIIANKPIHK